MKRRVITLSDEELKHIGLKSRILADLRYKEMLKRNHRTTREQNRNQWETGFQGEFAARKGLLEFLQENDKSHIQVSEPDMEVRGKNQRRHDADLTMSSKDGSFKSSVSVKTDGQLYPYSWTFSKSYPTMVTEEFWNYQNHFLVPVHKISHNEFELLGLFDINKLVKGGFFGPPEREYLRNFKSCLYLDDKKFPDGVTAKGLNQII